MYRTKTFAKNLIEYALPWIILFLLLTYSYARFFRHSHGIAWRGDGTVTTVYINQLEPTIHQGDRLVQVGNVPFEAFRKDLLLELFTGAREGDVVPVTIERNGQAMEVQWRVPGPNGAEQRDQLFTPWFLAFFFWGAGTATLLLVRPRDMRWLLLGLFNFLTALGLAVATGLSAYHILYSAFVLRVTVWLALPVFLHLHWIFPKPLGRLPRWLLWTGYAICIALAVAQCLQLVPAPSFYVAFLVAILGSLGLLGAHTARQPEMRRDLRTLLIAAVLAIIPPALLIGLSALRVAMPRVASLAIFSLPILPAAYLYAAYRKQLGGLEMRVNRAISIYAFLIVLGIIIVPVLVAVQGLPMYSADEPLITTVMASIAVTALSLWGFPRFQAFVEHRMLGIAVPSRELQQTYSAHITRSSSFAELTRLLDKEILPSLLVRQFAFLILEDGSSQLLLSRGLSGEQIPGDAQLTTLAALTGRHPARGLIEEKAYSWVRLVLALKVQDELDGFWLFGRRDPNDTYSSAEVPVLQLFADQTAVALSNILQSERLRAMYQANINRHENERLSLARDLHDSVLSALAGMLMNTDIRTLPKGFQEGYQALTQRLREIVSELRPPMLSYGLKPAIEELADSLMERSEDTVAIVVNLEDCGKRYPADKEQHLFRITQEACENAVRHAHCKNITISGRLDPGFVEMRIKDDGDGFKLAKDSMQLYDLLARRHFGLAGMLERAAVIDAEIGIDSLPGAGTQISVKWKADGRGPGEIQGAGISFA
jgi:signal transduction histidine kinase